MNYTDKLTVAEQIPLKLHDIYKRYGYEKYQMAKFESYDLYLRHRNYLFGENIITFSDATGNLLALKPDVTMSIVNNVDAEKKLSKLFYIENVIRQDRGSKEYREINQIGLEYIGGDSGYAESEVVSLALTSLAMLGDSSMLCIGHIGFVSSYLDYIKVEDKERERLFKVIKSKNFDDLRALLTAINVKDSDIDIFISILTINAPFKEAIVEAEKFAVSVEMKAVIKELNMLYEAIASSDMISYVRIDFSVINDLLYYNGLIFQGYIEGINKAVLAGGRYDNLMKLFDKPQCAIGFALYSGDIARLLRSSTKYDVDILLTYTDAVPSTVLNAVNTIVESGHTVRAVNSNADDIRAMRRISLTKDGRMEEAKC